ncbi:MAG: tagatose 1,6-diphosphate aldolase [Acidimicrobiia bacterium]
MAELSAGKVRRLTALAGEGGVFTILAVDHRDSMRVVLDPDEPRAVPASELTGTKLWLLSALAGGASAVLVDPEYSALQAVADQTLPGNTPFLCAVESQGYLGAPDSGAATLLDGWSVAKAARLGAAGIKLLILYRPDGALAAAQHRVVEAVVADCAREQIPLFLEPVAYGLPGGPPPGTGEFAAQRRRIVCDSARALAALGPDVLKVQFPVDAAFDTDRASWADACEELSEAAGIPWAVLSGGDPFESFLDQVETACDAGASGFLVGRSLWGDAVTAPRAMRDAVMADTVRPRLAELCDVATARGSDWALRHSWPAFDEHAYHTF